MLKIILVVILLVCLVASVMACLPLMTRQEFTSGVTVCPAGTQDCQGTGICQTNTNTNVSNCGGCGRVCFTTNGIPNCINGQCGVSSCNPGFANCDGTPDNGCESKINTDINNCGGCGKKCITTNGIPNCINGQCGISSCNSGFVNCNSACINPLIDSKNCGSCAVECVLGKTCVAGVCKCPSGSVDCAGACVDPLTDNSNCGSCGVVCVSPKTCVAGVCQCPSGKIDCNGVCVNLQSNDKNCGGCGVVCAAGKSCVNGQCKRAL